MGRERGGGGQSQRIHLRFYYFSPKEKDERTNTLVADDEK